MKRSEVIQVETVAIAMYESNARTSDVTMPPWHDVTSTVKDEWRAAARLTLVDGGYYVAETIQFP